ncbi:MAG: hypothetical protein IKZ84_17430, partial [Victivallales bacterium]|nr:hypothetical protein [Victivallales bacterium]
MAERKTREAEDMWNYTEYLMKKAEEKQEEKVKMELLEKLEVRHYSDVQIMDLLGVDIEQLKLLCSRLQER